MKAQAGHLRKLLEELCRKTGEDMTPYGLEEAAKKIDKTSDRYLYRVYNQIDGRKDTFAIELNDRILNDLTKYLNGFTYLEFVKHLNNPIDPVLLNTEGNYWSYVRMNSEDGFILCSPAKITAAKNSVLFELKGPKSSYHGEVIVEGGCLFITMRTGNGKSFHHVYKIGRALGPYMLYGVFSGVSSMFDPIAGRCILVRTDEQFKDMKNEKVSVTDMRKKKGKLEKALAGYFKERSENNLIVKGITTADLQDLGTGSR